MKRTASERETSRSSGSSTSRSLHQRALSAAKAGFVLCVDSGDHVDLDIRKVYRVLPDRDSSRHGMIRVIDESGEDYLYPVDLFVPIQLSERAAKIAKELAF